MISILNVLSKLRELSGNAQLEFLEKNKSDLLKSILLYTYDPHKLYKIDEGKFNKTISRRRLFNVCGTKRLNEEVWKYYTNKLDALCNKRSAKDSDVEDVKSFIASFESELERNLLKQVLFKDLRLNMGIKKFQKVWPDFCVEPQVQLAQMYEGNDFENGVYSRKFDGKRMYIMEGVAYSRSNKPCKVPPVSHIVECLKELSNEYVFDGEVIYFDDNYVEDFQKGISLTSNDNRCEECNNIRYVVFDMIPIDIFKSKDVGICFADEYSQMLDILGGDEEATTPNYSLVTTKFPNIYIARQCSSKDILDKLRKDYEWEGLMYRNADQCYEFKRTKNLLKIKNMFDGEFDLISLTPGTGKNKNRLGTIWINFKGNETGVGSGLTDEQRDIFWANKDKICSESFKNKYSVKVQYFEETVNQQGLPSLRFPVFLCFRNKETGEELLTIN